MIALMQLFIRNRAASCVLLALHCLDHAASAAESRRFGRARRWVQASRLLRRTGLALLIGAYMVDGTSFREARLLVARSLEQADSKRAVLRAWRTKP